MIVIEKLENKNEALEDVARHEDMMVSYGPDMFRIAKPVIEKYEKALALDEEGMPVAWLTYKPDIYTHRYDYSGRVDMWFLNQYDCLFLHECNEYSVELCQSVLKLWEGRRLVLVGKSWERMIPLLPDLPHMECFYEESLSEELLLELINGMKYLHVIYGVPHAEPIDRYAQGIMFYDEIMSFTFLFSSYREMGEKNEDKKFFVMDGYYGKLGLFALFPKVEICARYAKSKGFIPVIQLKMPNNCFYKNSADDDVWAKFYNQPEGYSIEEVMQSKHVYFCPGLYNGSVQSYIMEQFCEDTALSWPDGIYNDRVKRYLEEREKLFLPYPDRTLGVLARGTDYVNTHLHNHPIHASIELLCEKIDCAMQEWKLDYIYVATEDEKYCSYLKERYKDKITFTDQKRYSVKEGEKLADMHARNEEKRDGYILGVEYILSIYLLAKCNSLIASGKCGGVNEALKENAGAYNHVFVFDLGINP